MKAKNFFRASRGLITTAHLSTGSDQLLGPGITQVLATPLVSTITFGFLVKGDMPSKQNLLFQKKQVRTMQLYGNSSEIRQGVVTPICTVFTAKTGHLNPVYQGVESLRFLPHIIRSKDKCACIQQSLADFQYGQTLKSNFAV